MVASNGLAKGRLRTSSRKDAGGLEVQVKVVRTLTSIIIWAPKWTRSTGYQGGNRW
jgi:hypothetical protein